MTSIRTNSRLITIFKMKRNSLLLLLLLSGLAGCSSIATNGSPGAADSGNTDKSAAANKTLVLPDPNETLGAVVNFVVEPLTSGWRIKQTRIGENRFRIELRRKRFTTGGDGEVTQVFYRRAEQIIRENGYAGYIVVEFGEGIDSMFPVSQRVAQ